MTQEGAFAQLGQKKQGRESSVETTESVLAFRQEVQCPSVTLHMLGSGETETGSWELSCFSWCIPGAPTNNPTQSRGPESHGWSRSASLSG